jgi:predicted GIY-YIG superfamily endonuclease
MSVLIYKLYSENDCYIGSTKHPLHKRLSQHKSPHNCCCSKTIIESENYNIEKVAEVEADERFKKEQQFINEQFML